MNTYHLLPHFQFIFVQPTNIKKTHLQVIHIIIGYSVITICSYKEKKNEG